MTKSSQGWMILKSEFRFEGDLLLVSKFYGQATKGAWWMPWQKQAMKDVASCDKLR